MQHYAVHCIPSQSTKIQGIVKHSFFFIKAILFFSTQKKEGNGLRRYIYIYGSLMEYLGHVHIYIWHDSFIA